MLFPKKQGKETRVQDLFETFSRLSRLFRDFFQILGGSGAAGPRDTFFRLFWGFGPKGPRDPCKWSTGSQIYSTLSALGVYNNQSPTLPDLARHQQIAFSVHTPKLDARRPSSDIRRRIEWGQPSTHTHTRLSPAKFSFHLAWPSHPDMRLCNVCRQSVKARQERAHQWPKAVWNICLHPHRAFSGGDKT